VAFALVSKIVQVCEKVLCSRFKDVITFHSNTGL